MDRCGSPKNIYGVNDFFLFYSGKFLLYCLPTYPRVEYPRPHLFDPEQQNIETFRPTSNSLKNALKKSVFEIVYLHRRSKVFSMIQCCCRKCKTFWTFKIFVKIRFLKKMLILKPNFRNLIHFICSIKKKYYSDVIEISIRKSPLVFQACLLLFCLWTITKRFSRLTSTLNRASFTFNPL